MQSSESSTLGQTSAAESAGPSRPSADGIYRHFGTDVVRPRIVQRVKPKYPKEARKKKFAGTVIVGLVVGIDGTTTNVRVVRSAGTVNLSESDRAAALSLDQSALDAVSKYRFLPTTLKDTTVPVEIGIEVNYKLE